jgi:hypothetical protein
MSTKADIVIENAKVFTSNEAMPHAEAVAVKGNRIVFVGQMKARMNSKANPPASSTGRDAPSLLDLSTPISISCGERSGRGRRSCTT